MVPSSFMAVAKRTRSALSLAQDGASCNVDIFRGSDNVIDFTERNSPLEDSLNMVASVELWAKLAKISSKP